MPTTHPMPPPAHVERAAYDTSVVLFQPKHRSAFSEQNARVLSLAKYAVLEVLTMDNRGDLDEPVDSVIGMGVCLMHRNSNDAMREIHALADALGLVQLPLPGTEVRQ